MEVQSLGAESMVNPEVANVFECKHTESGVNSSELAYAWEIVDVISGAKLSPQHDN